MKRPYGGAVALPAVLFACQPPSSGNSQGGAMHPPAPSSASSSSAAPNVTAVAPPWRSVVRPDVVRLVDDLATAKRVESEKVGEGGERSAVFTKFAQLRKLATAAEWRAVARHESPVVRVYAGHALTAIDKDATELVTLRYDTTRVDTLIGCERLEGTVASALKEGL